MLNVTANADATEIDVHGLVDDSTGIQSVSYTHLTLPTTPYV